MLDFCRKTRYNEKKMGSFIRVKAMKKSVFFLILGAVWAMSLNAQAQLAFWNYDDGDNEVQIPAECDGVFDESRGGVFVPTAEQMAERGEDFLLNADPVVRGKAGYCLIAAAMLGHIPSQYRVAQLYAKGIVLPQDDLSAYRWAFLASLNGHEEATKLALLLERFLTTEDIALATASIQSLTPEISGRYKAQLAEHDRRIKQKKAELKRVNDEIDVILGIKEKTASLEEEEKATKSVEQIAMKAAPGKAVFSEKDRMK